MQRYRRVHRNGKGTTGKVKVIKERGVCVNNDSRLLFQIIRNVEQLKSIKITEILLI